MSLIVAVSPVLFVEKGPLGPPGAGAGQGQRRGAAPGEADGGGAKDH